MEIIRYYNKWPWGNSVILITNDGLGTATVTFPKDTPDIGLISDMSVHVTNRLNGYGNRLLETCEEEIKRHGITKAALMAKVDTTPYYWYLRHGYELCNELEFFPQFDDDAILVKLAKDL